MAKGMWLEHPEGQEEAERYANMLRDVAKTLPDGEQREAVIGIAAFLGAISDPDNPPMTRQEMRDGFEWCRRNPEELNRKRNELKEASANLRAARLAAEAADAAE